MRLKQGRNTFLVIANANSTVQHAIEIKNGTIKHVIVNIKLS